MTVRVKKVIQGRIYVVTNPIVIVIIALQWLMSIGI